MNAFARALASLHRDGNLSVACTWQRGAGAPVACRGILSQPVEEAFGAAQRGGVARRVAIDIAVADVPDIARGDVITFDDSAHKVETALRDTEALTWRLILSILG